MFDVSFRLSEAERNLKKFIYLKKDCGNGIPAVKGRMSRFFRFYELPPCFEHCIHTHVHTHSVKYKKVWNNVKNPIYKVIHSERKNVSPSSEHTG